MKLRSHPVTVFAFTVAVPALVLGLVGARLLHPAGVAVSAAYLVGLCAVGFALLQLGRYLLRDLDSPASPHHGPQPAPSRRPDLIGMLERRVANATRERHAFEATLQPQLWQLAAERVRLRTGANLDELTHRDPQRARQLAGDEVWQWLTTRDRRATPPTAEQIRRLVDEVRNL
jgi:hypothetical protein